VNFSQITKKLKNAPPRDVYAVHIPSAKSDWEIPKTQSDMESINKPYQSDVWSDENRTSQ
jgi:hypothetical protein